VKEIVFALKEFCEIRALKTIIQCCKDFGYSIHWKLLNFSVNTDFAFCSIEDAFAGYVNVSVISADDCKIISEMKIYSFKTDMTHQLDSHAHAFISCAEVAACRSHKRIQAVSCTESPCIVLGNVKIKAPVEDFQVEIFERLANLPYHVVIVPRHPLTEEEMKIVRLPDNLEFRNTMGELEDLQASASLTIMGRIFSVDGLKPDDDHNPLEATINSNTLCGIIKEIPEAYAWMYEKSGLVHQCKSYDEVFSKIDALIFDPSLAEKLQQREAWIQSNRRRYLENIKVILEL